MRPAQQLDFPGHICQGRVDLLVGNPFPWLDRKAADLKQVNLAVSIDGEFDVNRVAGKQRLELGDEAEDGGKRGWARIGSGLEAQEGLQIVARAPGDTVG